MEWLLGLALVFAACWKMEQYTNKRLREMAAGMTIEQLEDELTWCDSFITAEIFQDELNRREGVAK